MSDMRSDEMESGRRETSDKNNHAFKSVHELKHTAPCVRRTPNRRGCGGATETRGRLARKTAG